MKNLFFVVIIVQLIALGCSEEGDSKGEANGDNNLGVRPGVGATFTGSLTSVSVSASLQKSTQVKEITHIMGVAPSTGNAQRFVAEVSEDGSFSLDVITGQPYLIVFISQDGSLMGPDMVVGTVKVDPNNNDLDTLAPTEAGTVDLGEVDVDGVDEEATPAASLEDLLDALGLTEEEASFLGDVDDLALRLANPDVDYNGVIDANEGKSFGMDWHVRANTHINSASNTDLKMADLENKLPPDELHLKWTLASGYAVYPKSFDDTNYVDSNNSLVSGGSFTAPETALAPTSYSGGMFGDSRQWGPDYNMMEQEMGASDATATFTYILGSDEKKLVYSHVRTKTRDALEADGVLLPFLMLNTTEGKFTGISYEWRKRTESSWVAASSAEVSLLVQSSGAFLTLYTEKDSSNGIEKGISFSIPPEPTTGTINVGDEGVYVSSIEDVTDLTLDDFCSSALSYDDKMGLRLFAGSPRANDGVSACP